MAMKLAWTDEMIAAFCEIVPGRTQGQIADEFERQLGIRLSVSQIKNAKMRFGVRSGTNGGQFVKGQRAWNKGMPLSEWMSPEAEQRCAAGRFKPGNLPHNSSKYRIGDERVNGDGYVEVKIMDRPTDGHHNNWKPKHLLVWEREHGCKVPNGHAVIFADNDRTNFDPGNLVAITRADLVSINRMGLAHCDADTVRLCQGIVGLSRAINHSKLTARKCAVCGTTFKPDFASQRRCRKCIDDEPSFKRSMAGDL